MVFKSPRKLYNRKRTECRFDIIAMYAFEREEEVYVWGVVSEVVGGVQTSNAIVAKAKIIIILTALM